jgi:hypothetical protein
MSLLDMGFTRDVGRETAQLSQNVDMETEEEGGPSSLPSPMPEPRAIVAARTMQPLSRHAIAAPISPTNVDTGTLQGHQFSLNRLMKCVSKFPFMKAKKG